MQNMLAQDVMTPDVLQVGEDWPVDKLAEFLLENSVSGAPVVSEQGKLVGVVSLTDIVRYQALPAADQHAETHEVYLHDMARRYAPAELETLRIEAETTVTVRDIMTPLIFQVQADTSVREVVENMQRGRIHRIFVTEKGLLIGVITALDLLEALFEG